MKKRLYAMTYWFRDTRYGKEHSGTFYTYSLTEVFGFGDFIKRVGGEAHCDIGTIGKEKHASGLHL